MSVMILGVTAAIVRHMAEKQRIPLVLAVSPDAFTVLESDIPPALRFVDPNPALEPHLFITLTPPIMVVAREAAEPGAVHIVRDRPLCEDVPIN